MYTLKQMEAFYWSAELGSFSASSKKLHTTQSAIAKRVGELESFGGGPLLDRRTKRLALTTQGRMLFDLAKQTLELNSRVLQQFTAPENFAGVVKMGVTELIALTWLAPLIKQVGRAFPKLKLMPEIDGGMTLYQQLEQGLLDLAIMPGPFWSYEYDCVPLGSIVNEWMVSPSSELASKGSLTPQDFADYPVISQPTNSALSHLYDSWFSEQGVRVQRVLTCNSLIVVARLTMLGVGVSYLPTAVSAPMIERGEIVPLKVVPPLPRVHYYAVFKKNVTNPLTAKVIETAQAVCDFDADVTHSLPWTSERSEADSAQD